MRTPEGNWERLVRAALRKERLGVGVPEQPVTGVAGSVPSSLANSNHIDEILRAADAIEDEDPSIARILCEHAYSLAQKLDPDCEGRGVLQFKTGLASVIKQKLAKRDGGTINRSQDIARLQEFYKYYREKNKADELCADEMKLRESSVFSGNLGELEKKTVKRKKVFATLRILGTVLEELTKEMATDDAEKLISEEMKRVMEKDAAMMEDVIAYNIIPLDAPSMTNVIVDFPEVKAAISSLTYQTSLPRLPSDFPLPAARSADVLDLLHYIFGFQKDNVSNQREHIIHLLANEQSRFGTDLGSQPTLHVRSSNGPSNTCQGISSNYYLSIVEKMAGELEEILRQPVAQPAGSCTSDDEVSFLSQVIFPLYEVIAAGLTIIAFNNGMLNSTTLKQILSLCPTYAVMKFIESVLDAVMMYGAYSTSRRSAVTRIFWRFLWFAVASFVVCYLYIKALQDGSNSAAFRIYVFIVGIYAAFKLFIGFLMRIPFCHRLTDFCYRWSLVRLVKWLHQENYYVGRGMYEKTTDYIKYVLFWLVVLSGKFSFAYFLQESDLFLITWLNSFNLSLDNYNALTILSLWAPIFAIYLLDIHIFYTLVSAVYGFLLGARDRLGEIRSVEALHTLFEKFPGAFMANLHVPLPKRNQISSSGQGLELNRFDAARFAPFWNKIVDNLREEDYINNSERDLLIMPKNSGIVPMVQWPLFLLTSKIFLARDTALESKDSQDDLWFKISRDEYMRYAVEECYYSVKVILMSLLEKEGRMWVDRIYEDIHESIRKKTIQNDFDLSKLHLVISRISALTGILKGEENPKLLDGAVNAVQDLYDVVHHDVLTIDMRGNIDAWSEIMNARADGRLFSNLNWPKNPELKELIKRLYAFLTINESAANVPRNLEARRRLQFFTNSLFMKMPVSRPVSEMLSFSVFTPYYSEVVLYSLDELYKKNEDGISTLFYLQKIFPDEWKNFLSRIGRKEDTEDSELLESPRDVLELRFWASYRGQTLARTVRGMMYYRKALMLQSYMEKIASEDGTPGARNATDIAEGFDLSPEARARADLKFTYVVTCQIYGKQKEERKPEAADIAMLMQRNEALRIAYIDVLETVKSGKPHTEYYSKLVKADIHGKDKEIYSIKLPGNPKLGEGKPENQNHAIIFTRGNAVQTIDMNQDNYFEEALKMRNLLEEFHCNHGKHKPTILGVREHVFTGSVSSLALFMSNQETSFVTLGQRVLANPLKVRMHYGHPDVFDRVFHITRGGISKASRIINISEDIYAGFNSTLRQGNITHHEYIQVGKGRDVGLNQIALFEGKVAGGNGEQVLSRDVYRLGQLFDFFRMMSFYVTTVGFYFCTMLTVLTVYIFLYGKTYLALSGIGEAIQIRADILQNTALDAALNTQFLFQIGVFTAVPMILGFILEYGFLSAVVSFTTMQLQLCSVFFTFSLGTRTHYFGRTILHGGAKYRATGRGFVVRHIKFAENYRLYSRSHFVKGLEVVLLLIIFLAYGYNNGGAVSYILLSVSSWIMALSWLFAPYLFNPSGFEWQKAVEDFRDWTNWLFYRGGIGVKGEESWEAWWDEELAHIHTLRGRILETFLSCRFFIFQYGIVYKLHASGSDTSLTVYGWSWIVLAGLFILFQVFTFSHKAWVNFQLPLRLIQSITLLMALAGVAVAIAITELSVPDIFAAILAFIPTGWGILSIAVAWKPLVKKMRLWKSVRSLARLYDAGMGMFIFVPVAMFSWFPFVSTFQTRLLFNQAFSRGLEISLILAGNNPNTGL
ncbi:Callose synthase 9 [Canna indica]|uniref:Callose synthase 9 n=1 Tax=Canna indica TaxID=4628 RepID=A0AAQ3KEL9_9LILI|nr:Callose synthase 9 [Canna indica]